MDISSFRKTVSQGLLVTPLRLKIPILRTILSISVIFILFFVVVPSLYNIIWAFWGSGVVGVLHKYPSTYWFSMVLNSSEWRLSFLYSFALATAVSLAGCSVLVVHFYFMRYAPSVLGTIGYVLTLIPIVVPAVIYALALKIVGAKLHAPEILLVLIGNFVFVIPLQFFILESAQETIPSNLLYAGNALGAKHMTNILFNYFPLLRRPLSAAFLIGFFYSLDELVIASFVIDSSLVTIPRRLWDQVPRSMDPAPAVVSCLLLLTYLLITLVSIGITIRSTPEELDNL